MLPRDPLVLTNQLVGLTALDTALLFFTRALAMTYPAACCAPRADEPAEVGTQGRVDHQAGQQIQLHAGEVPELVERGLHPYDQVGHNQQGNGVKAVHGTMTKTSSSALKRAAWLTRAA